MSKTFTEQKFNIPELEGISKESITQHLGLYAGYVKNFNSILDLSGKLSADPVTNSIALSELQRRLSFEFGGLRLHEYYFEQFEGGAKALNQESALAKKMIEQFGDTMKPEMFVRNVAGMRGPGWSILYYDPKTENLMFGFSEEQHLGHFVSLPIILALDVWEHTYILDYGAAGRGKYIEVFFKNLNWSVVEKNFTDAQK
jgi:superoxide dismutase, Fe-Mn family